MTLKYFVALDPKGAPVSQRSTLRSKAYVAADASGSYSSVKSPRHPLRVIQVETALEWVTRATLPDGSKIVTRSKSGPTGRNYIRYAYSYGDGSRHEKDLWTDDTKEEFEAGGARCQMGYEVLAFAVGETELREWPVEVQS